ncbi:MAG TPA: acylphosphatase [Candidatus Cloacimonadota bacterium]|nr:acylphosphatase [Candidatus Cloacimonadota bacterium]HQH50223.1 acylphosphatase [Candidatus Cloacimonadota bacterium]
MPSWEIEVRGRVQGVGFRRFAYRCAQLCKIRGYAKNKADGSVYILAQGCWADFELFCTYLRAGRGFILVRDMETRELDNAIEYKEFEIH